MRFNEFGPLALRELTLQHAERSDQNHLRDVASVTHNDGAFRFIGPTFAKLRRTGERECNRTSAQRRCDRHASRVRQADSADAKVVPPRSSSVLPPRCS